MSDEARTYDELTAEGWALDPKKGVETKRFASVSFRRVRGGVKSANAGRRIVLKHITAWDIAFEGRSRQYARQHPHALFAIDRRSIVDRDGIPATNCYNADVEPR